MLDACPHHHDDETNAADALDGLNLREPRNSNPVKRKLWRSLDELSATPAFEQMLHREFPHAAAEWTDEPSRRHFMKLMGASLALAGLSACTLKKTQEAVVPYVEPPEEVIPGRPLFFASTMNWMGYGKGVVVESHEGRPTKIEGNRDHPSSKGAADIHVQASILEMYDPDRSQTVRHGNDTSTWGAFVKEMADVMAKWKSSDGAGVRFLTGTTTSPTVARLMNEILEKYPQARWHQHETVGRANARAAAIEVFGRDLDPVYSFEKATVVLSLDSNFLSDLPGSMAYANGFITGRRVRQGDGALSINRMYCAEPSVTITGAKADHRLAIKGGEVEQLARDIAAAVGGAKATGPHAAWVNAVAGDLVAAKGTGLVIAGETQPAIVHAIAYALNETLGNVGQDKPVRYVDPIEACSKKTGPLSLEDLVREINLDPCPVDVLFILGTNPCFTAPLQLKLREGLTDTDPLARQGAYKTENPLHRVEMVVHHGLYGAEADETAAFAHWHVPASHYLEMWGDLRGHDGTASIIQPLIEPLYSSKSDVELLTFLAGYDADTGYDTVKQTWQKKYAAAANVAGADDFETYWAKSVELGVFANSAYTTQAATAKVKLADLVTRAPTTQPNTMGVELCFRPDPSIWDGRYANLAWLQELPKPISLLTWDTAAFMSMATAKAMKLPLPQDQGRGMETRIVKLTYQGRELVVPAFIMPGHADGSITIYTGYGRVRGGRVTQSASGSDAFVLRPAFDAWYVSGVGAEPQEDAYLLATAQSHHLIDVPADADKRSRLDDYWLKERDLIHSYTVEDLAKTTTSAEHAVEGTNGPKPKASPHRRIALPIQKEEQSPDMTLLPAWKYDYNKWGMVIDNQACIGCNACITACQSENNIAVVGKEMVLRGRIMLWLRIDTYFDGESDGTPNVYFQPIPCMHCENAPCTLVCPVEATTISAEGINEMTYNRCVGTRYCSNNCPYKVRRFNFMQWTDYETPQFMLQRNPNVTVRARGVMEKCNYCVQRINNGRIEAKKLDRPINPGEVITACAQACPTKAIAFGNLNDPRWEVTKLQAEPLRYSLLDELNTLPRTTYLPIVTNPHPGLPVHYGSAEEEPAAPAI
jgi:MoCo/4Fe-4S cofactor protein with predicted Tat translocation signal